MNRKRTEIIDLLDELLIRTVFDNKNSERVGLSDFLQISVVPKPFLGMEILDRLQDREIIDMPSYVVSFFERGDAKGEIRLINEDVHQNSIFLAELQNAWKSLKWQGYECCAGVHGMYIELVIAELWNAARYHAGRCDIYLEEIYPAFSVLAEISNNLTIGKIVLGMKNSLGVLKDSGYKCVSFDVLIKLAIRSIQTIEEDSFIRLGVVEKCTPKSMLSDLLFVDLLGVQVWALDAALPWPYGYWGDKQIKGEGAE